MKGTYAATNFHHFRMSDRLEELVEDRRSLTIGIDLAKHEHFACVMTGFEEFAILKFHNRESREFIEWVRGLGVDVTLVVEPTGTYGDHLVDEARSRGVSVVVVPAKRTHDLCDLFDNVPSKFDGKSAYLLARLHLLQLSEALRQKTDTERELTALHAALGDANDAIGRLSGKIESMVARHWPEATACLSLTTTTLLTVFAEFGGPAQVAANAQEVAKRMRRIGGSLLAQEKIDALIASAHEGRGVDMLPGELDLLQRRARKLLQARGEARELKNTLERVVQADPELAHIAEFCGPAVTTAVVAFLGAVNEFTSAAALEKCAGLNLRWVQSGERNAWGYHISKRGNGRVRQLLFFFALRMIRKEQGCLIAIAWYRKRLQLNGGHKLKAIVALMRKLIRALYHVARGAEYDPTQLFDVSRLQVAT